MENKNKKCGSCPYFCKPYKTATMCAYMYLTGQSRGTVVEDEDGEKHIEYPAECDKYHKGKSIVDEMNKAQWHGRT